MSLYIRVSSLNWAFNGSIVTYHNPSGTRLRSFRGLRFWFRRMIVYVCPSVSCLSLCPIFLSWHCLPALFPNSRTLWVFLHSIDFGWFRCVLGCGSGKEPGSGNRLRTVQVWMGSDRFSGRFRRFWEVDLPKLPVPEVGKLPGSGFRLVLAGSGVFRKFRSRGWERSLRFRRFRVPMGSNRFRSSGDSVGEVRKVAAVSKISLVPAFEGHKSSA